MGKRVVVTDRKYRFQHSNGDDYTVNASNFSNHLTGNVFEKVQVTFTIEVSWHVVLEDYKIIDNGGNDYTFIKEGANFISNGFAIGDEIKITFDGGGTPINQNATITYVSEDEIRHQGITAPLPSGVYVGPDWIKGDQPLRSVFYAFGLPSNDGNFSTISRITGLDQSFFVSDFDTTLKEGVSRGNIKGHVTGDIQARFIQNVRDQDVRTVTNTTQQFEIIQEFRLLPNYLEGELTNLENLLSPELFRGDKTIKQVLKLDYRTTLNNPNTSKTGEDEGYLGSVGWFNENFNGYPNNYSFSNLTKTVQSTGLPASALDIGEVIECSFDVVKVDGFDAGQPFVMNHVYLPSESVYRNSVDDFNTTWVADSVRQTIGGAAVSGVVVKNLEISLTNATTVNVTFETEFNADQANRLEVGDNYHLFITCGTDPADVNNSDKVQLSVEVGQYDKNTDIPDLLNVDTFTITNLSGDSFTNYVGAIEDSLYANIRAYTDLSKSAIIDSWSFATIGFNTVDSSYFVIEETPLNATFIALPSGGQPVDRQFVDSVTLAGFEVEDEAYNTISVKSDTFDGTNQYYDLQIAFKVPWQDNEAIEAPISFFDSTKPNNGLNKNASNYSNVGDYEVRFALIVQMKTPDSIGNTEYVLMNQGNEIYKYDEIIS